MERTARWRLTLTLLAAVHLALAGWATVDAASFTDRIADFGPYNPHLVHDFAAASGTFGCGLLLAAYRPSWRTPVLALAAIWTGLHTVSHVVDVGDARPRAIGPAEAALLAAATALLAALAWVSSRSTSTAEER